MGCSRNRAVFFNSFRANRIIIYFGGSRDLNLVCLYSTCSFSFMTHIP